MKQGGALFEEHREQLFRHCYRLTGSAADADDLVQDTFIRATEASGDTFREPLRPWLMTIATRLSLDHLRKRKRRHYTGPWLPSPVDLELDAADPGRTPEQRLSDRESLSYGFLIALERLLPTQRAVFILRDAVGLSTRETAEWLEISEENVRAHLHRARAKMSSTDGERGARSPTDPLVAQTLASLFAAAMAGDVAGLRQLLTDDAVALSDGGGVYHAALHPVLGADNVARFMIGLAHRGGRDGSFEPRLANGSLVLLGEHPRPASGGPDAPKVRFAPRSVIDCAITPDGRVSRIGIILNPSKLTHAAGLRRVPFLVSG